MAGAHAMSHLGYTRATGDLDILIQTDFDNVQAVINSLSDFGAPVSKVKISDLQIPGRVFQIGVPPLRVDILTSLDGVKEEDVFKKRKKGRLLGVSVHFLDFDSLIKNKLKTGRPKDKLDVLELKKLKVKRKK